MSSDRDGNRGGWATPGDDQPDAESAAEVTGEFTIDYAPPAWYTQNASGSSSSGQGAGRPRAPALPGRRGVPGRVGVPVGRAGRFRRCRGSLRRRTPILPVGRRPFRGRGRGTDTGTGSPPARLRHRLLLRLRGRLSRRPRRRLLRALRSRLPLLPRPRRVRRSPRPRLPPEGRLPCPGFRWGSSRRGRSRRDRSLRGGPRRLRGIRPLPRPCRTSPSAGIRRSGLRPLRRRLRPLRPLPRLRSRLLLRRLRLLPSLRTRSRRTVTWRAVPRCGSPPPP
nr:SCO5717 family growth-regulating ATPase [Streptomyces afghaniensis]